jgi:hypothetical protein
MRRLLVRAAIVVAFLGTACLSTGCLVKDTSATLCLEPDGAVTWTVLEKNIHATGDTPADRQHEEDEFMSLVAADKHPKAVAFRTLGGLNVRTDVVSSHWPFAVLTEARFPDVAQIFQKLFDRIPELNGRSTLERDGNRTTWRITIEYDADAAQSESKEDETAGVLFDYFDDRQPVCVMRHGQFVDAVGFDITDDGRVAKIKQMDDHDWDKDPTLVLSLTWVSTEAVNVTRK